MRYINLRFTCLLTIVYIAAAGAAVVHLLEMMLMFNAAERLTADEALSHVYFSDCHHLIDADSALTMNWTTGSTVVCQHTASWWGNAPYNTHV